MVVTDGARAGLAALTGFYTLSLALFTGDVEPGAGVHLADLTEATFGGYARQTLTFPDPSLTGEDVAFSVSDPVTFTCDGSPDETVTLAGVVLSREGEDDLLYCLELVSPPQDVTLGTVLMREVTLTDTPAA